MSRAETLRKVAKPLHWTSDRLRPVGPTTWMDSTCPCTPTHSSTTSMKKKTRARNFSVSKQTEEFLNHHFSTKVDNATRRQWREKCGAPRLSSTACPKLDKILKPNLTSETKAKKAKDRHLSKTQALVLDAVGPLTTILESTARGKFDADATIKAVRTALKLLGNASGHLAMERRRNALSDLNFNLKDMAEEDQVFKDAAPQLFGNGFSKKAKERDDELKALRKSRQPPEETTGWRGKTQPHRGTRTKEIKDSREYCRQYLRIPISTPCMPYSFQRKVHVFDQYPPVNNIIVKQFLGMGVRDIAPLLAQKQLR